MDATEVDFGSDLQHPTDFLVGAIRLYGWPFVAECIAQARRQTETETLEVVEVSDDGR